MKIIGLIGGIGSGKSFVAELFQRLGAELIAADRIGHDVLSFPAVKFAARERWGNAVFREDELSRRELAKRVFAQTPQGRADLAFWNRTTHPPISEEIQRRIDGFRAQGSILTVLDAPILLETEWVKLVDRIIFVDAPYQVRLERVLKRGWTESELLARESTQLSLETKKARSDWVVDNSENSDKTLDQVKGIWQDMVSVHV